MSIGIILAGGDGTRLKAGNINKTVIPFNGKPLIQYGVDLFQTITDKTLIVVGAYAESVKAAVRSDNVVYTMQPERLGTGHAVKVAVEEIERQHWSPQMVLVGYGDHMMFYTPEIITQMCELHIQKKSVMTLVTTDYDNPNMLAWGRIIRGSDGSIEEIVEQKDATPEQLPIQELNTGFYCFDYVFLQETLPLLQSSPHSGEYYITDLLKIARERKQIALPYKIPFKFVGIGINTPEQLVESENLHKTLY